MIDRQLEQVIRELIRSREQGDGDRVNRGLREFLVRIAPGLPSDYPRTVVRAIAESAMGARLFARASEKIANATKDLSFVSLSADSWLTLRYLLISHGFLVASGIARDNARKAALRHATTDQGQRSATAVVKAVQASLDLGDIPLARSLRSWLGDPHYVQGLEPYLEMCSGNPSPEENPGRPECDSVEFTRLIKDRTVAVVGPATGGAKNGDEIDGFDVVARVSYWGAESLPPRDEGGRRIDVSYYNVERGRRIANKECPPFLHDVRYAVFKGRNHVCGSLPSRAAWRPDNLYFAGHPHMIPIMVFDLLHFEPSRLKLFNTNFFLADTLYYDNYAGHVRKRRLSREVRTRQLLTFASHDLCDQVNFVRNLTGVGCVELDDMGSRVIDKTNEDYLMEMESFDWVQNC